MNAEEIRELFAYDRWANARVLDVASALDAEKLLKDGAASYGSVFGTLQHILWSEWIWLGRWTRPVKTPDPRFSPTFDELRARWTSLEEEQRAYLDTVADADLPHLVTYVNTKGETWTYPLRDMFLHVVNHGTYHRGQLTTMFREHGAEPVELDFLVYYDEREGNVPSRASSMR